MAQVDFDPTKKDSAPVTQNDKGELEWNIQPVTPAQECESAILVAIMRMKQHKPDDRSAKDRYFAVAITDLEKVLAYVKYWIDAEEPDATQNPT